MGNWNINIQGVGAHHNKDYPKDANVMAQKFVEDLLAAGHQVEAASFTYGAKQPLVPPAEAEKLYATYCASSGGKNFRGEPCPAWADLPSEIRGHWAAVAYAVNYPTPSAP
jgi:hypothetical protein